MRVLLDTEIRIVAGADVPVISEDANLDWFGYGGIGGATRHSKLWRPI